MASPNVSAVPVAAATITIEAATPPTRSAPVVPVGPSPVSNLSSAPTPTPVVDFADDPFKDYRYEDPFNIEDPFADTETDATSSEDPFASTTTITTSVANSNNNNILSNKFDAKFSKTSTNSLEQLDDLFKGVRISGDGANDPSSLNNNSTASRLNNNIATASRTGTGAIGKTKPFTFDSFDAFNDNFSKNTNQTEDSLFSAFGSSKDGSDATDDGLTMDPFRVTTATSTVTSSASPAASSTMMMKSFEDEFSKMDTSNVLNNNNLTIGSASFSSGNEFLAKFDDAFSAFNTTTASTGSTTGSVRYGGSGG
uniref:Uncharacterized protein n=1 Tax=Anopheles maculatus TaxID=74869 RepID=A0A182T9H2_9DIPT